eukprot:m.1532653 g.1532653  ORF g.1532653 m.1532653 type:complete len:74 (+) comp25241_c0_seq5:894-1115(+)
MQLLCANISISSFRRVHPKGVVSVVADTTCWLCNHATIPNRKTTDLTVTIAKIKAHIKLVLEGLRELQQLEFL